MKMRTQKTLTFLFLLSFLFAQISESALPKFLSPAALNGFLKNNKFSLAEIRKKYDSFLKIPRKSDGRSIDFTKLNKNGEKIRARLEKTQERLEQAQDVYDAIQNLQNYGFLNTSLLQSNPPDKLEITDLQSAMSRIQENFNLTKGKFDQDTINIISKPRCDFPDKINGTNTLTKLINKQISLKPWWRNEKKNIVTYAFGNNVPVNVKYLFQATFMKSWSKKLMINFIETKSFKDSDILIAYVKVDAKGGVVGSWKCIFG
ncbi:unnamed protein product [Trifolium pratense]|uniref:Uncharacterized protein n=1 Tax=Trifolium pratense TaxID=57577 RepID=A0ACB0JRJ6_TRIPR|nr:unnamed protein product [Trifolium pratense]